MTEQSPNASNHPDQGQPQQPYGQPNQGAQQPYQGGAPNWAPPPPPAKKKKWPFIIGGIVVLIIIITVATGGGEKDEGSNTATTATVPPAAAETETSQAPPAEAEEQVAGLNMPARDGKFEFVVTGFEGGITTIGDNPYLTEEASGQFVVVDLTVKNTGDKAQAFTPSTQKLLDSQGREFEVNTTAMIAADSSDIPLFDNINPGNTVNISLVFDMPTDATPASLELHDSMFSGGVEVNLS